MEKSYCTEVFHKQNCRLYLFNNPVMGEDVIFHIKSIIIQDTYHAKEFIKNDSYIIDVGANIGIFSIFAAQLSKNGFVFSFEPQKDTFEILHKNSSFYKNIKIFKFALGDRERKEKILVFPISREISTMIDSDVSKKFTESFQEYFEEEVSVIPLDKFIRDNSIHKVDFIKIDTEGYELKILEGAKETIKKFKPIIAISAYHHPEHKAKIPEFILSLDREYKFKINTEGEEDFIFYI